MCARWLGHNDVLAQEEQSPWNRLLLKLIYESVTVMRRYPKKSNLDADDEISAPAEGYQV